MNNPDRHVIQQLSKINIGLDWDGTVTTNPEVFFQIATLFKNHGYGLYIVTMRYPSECANIPEKWFKLVDKIICTCRQAKQEVTEELGIRIHIWIDDNPKAVFHNALVAFGSSTHEGDVITPTHLNEDIGLTD